MTFPENKIDIQNKLSLFWKKLCQQACQCSDPIIKDIFAINICSHKDFPTALASLLAAKLMDRSVTEVALKNLFIHILNDDSTIALAAKYDMMATFERDPACLDLATPFLFFKGWQAIQAYRFAHFLWEKQRYPLAYHIQSRINERFAIDIHPAAKIGKHVSIDHGTGIVIGETTIIEDNVALFQNVTLGGTGKITGQRHPIIRDSAMIGAGAIILGAIEIGEHAKIGAASVILENIPPYTTAVGNPARIIKKREG